MSNDIAAQLSAALKASQERAQRGTPERAALDIITGEIDKLVVAIEKTPQTAAALEAQSTAPTKFRTPPGFRLLPAATTPFSLWVSKAKPGDTYIEAAVGKTENYFARYHTTAIDQGKQVTTERCVLVSGTKLKPVVTPVYTITMVGDRKPNEPVPPTGNPDGNTAD